jgi:hypothetical protein
MIALDDDGPRCGELTDAIDDSRGIGVVANQIAKKSILFRAMLASMVEAGLQGFQVGVDVRQQRDDHTSILP